MKIGFLGDLVIDRKLCLSPDLIAVARQLDFLVVNLEGVFLPNRELRPAKSYGSIVFNELEFVSSALNDLNVSHVNLYNNHMYDFGCEGLNFTLDQLNKLGVKLLSKDNEFHSKTDEKHMLNSGLAEHFGVQKVSEQFGQNANTLAAFGDMGNFSGKIVNTHFGTEMVKGLSAYEMSWFETISSLKPSMIIRHHPHCIQTPFFLNGVPCFSSIGDFAFNFGAKQISEGLFVVFDSLEIAPHFYQLKCDNGFVSMGKKSQISRETRPFGFDNTERAMLRDRYRSEYRESALACFRKSLKYLLGREKHSDVLATYSTHFIQPFILEDLL